jgi:Flp pilus assembly protein TadD
MKGGAAKAGHAASPGAPVADLFSAAVAHQQAGRFEDAVTAYRRLLALRPDLPEAQFNLGVALARLGRFEEAAGCFRRAIAHRPDYTAAHNNLGTALRELGRPGEAEAAFRAVTRLAPDLPQAHFNLGNALKALGRADAAEAAYRSALGLKPDYHDAGFNLATLLLARGDMAPGWEAFEARWHTAAMRADRRDFAVPLWRGEAGDGGTLLIHAEQGFGDTLQFCRYAPLAAARGWRVVLEVQPPLVRLLAGLPGIARIIARGEALPQFDRQCPMLSLPLAMGTTLRTVPAAASYLHADPTRAAELAARMAAIAPDGPRVGLAWAGNPRRDLSPAESAHAQRRSLDPALLAPLFDIPGLRFVSLQKAGPPAPPGLPMIDLMPEMEDFADTAALIAALDLVISVDTSVAHLAGALGRPVWVMTRRDHCWRWLEGRTDSPWYPSLRLYRQSARDDWTGVVDAVAADLRALTRPASHAEARRTDGPGPSRE